MSTIAVIGAGGYVGTGLIESLVLDGIHGVRAIVRAYRSVASLARFGNAIDVRIADAEDVESLRSALETASFVVNVTTGPPAGILRSTKAIYKAALTARAKRLIHLSSAVVFGHVESASIVDDSPPGSRHWMPYARAKSAAEMWLRPRMTRGAMETVVLRPGIVWGARSSHTLQLVRMLLNKAAYLVGDGSGIFNAIYIDNLVSCIRACCNSQQGTTGFFNVADDNTITWSEFLAAFAKHLAYDMTQISIVSSDRCPVDASLVLDWLLSLPGINGLYHRSKRYLPDAMKSRLKTWLTGAYNYSGAASGYVKSPHVDRELWHLQKVQYKLPHIKFAHHFGAPAQVPFEEGVRRTLNWLKFMGYARVG